MNTKSKNQEQAPSGMSGDMPQTSCGLQNDLFREVVIVWLAINLIDAAPRRVRRALEKQVEGVVEAVKAFGFRVPILVRKSSCDARYQVVDGHTRLEAARRLGAKQLPCILVDDLSETDVRRLTLSLNKLQETGQWDNEALRIEFCELLDLGVDLQVTGFEVPEIDMILEDRSVDETADRATSDVADALPTPSSQTVTRSGDI